jgi:hypothetical protein
MGKIVTAPYAKANLSRYKKPEADLVPSAAAVKPAPKFGTGRDKWKIIDPNWAVAMTDEEADAFIEGRS